MSFYVTLPSNSNLATHPNNRGGNFLVTLKENLYLDSTWDVGLAEAIYRKDWPNVREGENILVFDWLNSSYSLEAHKAWHRFTQSWSRKGKALQLELDFTWKGQTYAVPELDTSRPHLFPEVVQHIAYTIGNIVPGFELKLREDERALIAKIPSYGLVFGERLREELKFPTFNAGPPKKEKGGEEEQMEILDKTWSIPAHGWPTKRPTIGTQSMTVSLEQGYYPTAGRLVETINAKLQNMVPRGDKITLAAVDNEDFISFTYTPRHASTRRWWRLGMSQSLFEQLGFTVDQLEPIGGYYFIQHAGTPVAPDQATPAQMHMRGGLTLKGKRPMEITRGVDTLWIYSDIVAPQMVGNRSVPLLMILPSKGRHFGETVVIHYEKPQYIPLVQSTIAAISIQIYNTYGVKPIPFNSDVILKLHFRKRSD